MSTVSKFVTKYLDYDVCLLHLANLEFRLGNPVKRVPVLGFQNVDVESFTRDEITRLLNACTVSIGKQK